MKRLFIGMLIALSGWSASASNDSIIHLVEAMIYVESRGIDSAYRESELAVGCLQIRPVMVREVNRILQLWGSDIRYTLDDRWDRAKSIEMFFVVYQYYHSESTLEQIARCWNGGPNGMKYKQTKNYWNAVRAYIEENKCLRERTPKVR
jgi:hypothetical protein